MEQIIQTYGKVFLSAVSVTLLAVLLLTTISDEAGNRGIFRILGGYLESEMKVSEKPEEFQTMEIENQKSAPEISIIQSGTFSVGTIKCTEFLKAADYQGKELPVKLLKLENPAGEEMEGQSQWENGRMEVREPGIYTLTVQAMDEDNRKTVSVIRIPVNPARGFG